MSVDVFNQYEVAESGCWEWNGPGGRDVYGYGRFRIGGGKRKKAHRAFYERFVGVIPDGMIVRHLCDNPPCVNPAHLAVGTHHDNAQDRVRHGRTLKGERNPRALLAPDDVLDILARRRGGETGRSLAAAYGVTPSTVSGIVHGRIWSHVTGIGRRQAA